MRPMTPASRLAKSMFTVAIATMGISLLLIQYSFGQEAKERASLKAAGDNVFCLAFSPDGKTLATGGLGTVGRVDPGTVQLWDMATGTVHTSIVAHERKVICLTFSPDGKTLATGGGDWNSTRGQVNLWDGVTGKEKVTLTNSGDTFHCLAISPDGKILAGGNTWKNGIRLWDLATGHELANLEVSEGGIGQRIAFSPDGKTLATGSARSMTVHLFDVAGGNERAALKGRPGAARCLAFSPDGKTLACGGYLDTGKQPPVEGQMMLWDLTTGKEKRAAEGHIGHVRSVAFSPDGKFLASGGSDQLVKFWDVAEGHEQAILKGHKAVVTCVAFSPDGKTLASGSTDGEVKLWDVSVKEAK